MESYKNATTRIFAELHGMLSMIPEADGRKPLVYKMLILRDEINAKYRATGLEKRTAPFNYRVPLWAVGLFASVTWLLGKLV